jgi:glycosyltransferase involved in cell wall biosynthesis
VTPLSRLARVPARSLRIAWLGPVPGGNASAKGVNAELLHGLARIGHRVDCFFPSAGSQKHHFSGERGGPLPTYLTDEENLTFIWGTSQWRWNRWYSRTRATAFATGLLWRALASVRLRREIARRHAQEPYDLIFQTSAIESLAVPPSVTREIPLVIRPDTHMAGELRWLIAERRLGLRCQPPYIFVLVAAIMSVRALLQRISIRRADLVVCISGVFRDHLVRDYGVPLAATVIVPNPVRLDRFTDLDEERAQPPTVLVLGRVSARKGIEDVVSVARALLEQDVDARVRVVGGPSLWSDYTDLLEDLPLENSEYVGAIPSSQVPEELARSAILLQASKYEPFALTVAEALAAGVPVVATSEVGAIEGIDGSVATTVRPGDVQGMSSAIVAMLERLRDSPVETRTKARAEAERRFAPSVVCERISTALERLVSDADDG